MTTMTMTGTETEVFSGHVEMGYSHNDYFGTSGMRFIPSKPTEVVNDPIMNVGAGVFLADDNDHTANIASMTGVEVPLFDPLKASNRIKKSTVDTRPDLNLLGNIGEANGRAVGVTKTTALIGFLAKAASDDSNTVNCNDDVTDGTAPENVVTAINTIAENMDLAGIPAQGRFGMLHSHAWYELLRSNNTISRDFGGQANRQTAGGNMAVINYINFDIKNCGLGAGQGFLTDWDSTAGTNLGLPSVSKVNRSDVIGVFWHMDSWALRQQVALDNSIDWIARLQDWQCLTRLHWGCAVKQVAGIWAIVRV